MNISLIIRSIFLFMTIAGLCFPAFSAEMMSDNIKAKDDTTTLNHDKALAKAMARLSEEMKSKTEWTYTNTTGRPATRENLIDSLKKNDKVSKNISEICDALRVIIAREYKGDDIVNAIFNCYNEVKRYYMKIQCVDTMFYLDDVAAEKMAIKIWEDKELEANDPDGRIDYDLSLAEVLVSRNRKRLFAYPAIRQGLLGKLEAPNKFAVEAIRKKAEEVLELYRPYDGQVYNEQGAKIDIKALEAEVKAQREAQPKVN